MSKINGKFRRNGKADGLSWTGQRTKKTAPDPFLGWQKCAETTSHTHNELRNCPGSLRVLCEIENDLDTGRPLFASYTHVFTYFGTYSN